MFQRCVETTCEIQLRHIRFEQLLLIYIVDIPLMEEILHQLMLQVGSLSSYFAGFYTFIHPRWLFGVSEPSTVV